MSKQETVDSYAWTMNWVCPQCKKTHEKPHFAFPDQVDESKKPSTVGRIKNAFKRENSDTIEKLNCKEYTKDQRTGSVTLSDGKQAPLFCPHCGWIDDLIYVTRKKKSQRKRK